MGTSYSASRPARVLLVDDHPVVRLGLSKLIQGEADLSVCGEAEDVAGALVQLRSTRPDLVILDISLRGASGLELLKSIRAQGIQVKVLVASIHDESLYADRVLRAGAMGYISKEASDQTLLSAIRQVLEGHLYLSEAASDRALRRMIGRGTESSGSPLDALSDRELEVFDRIGRGLATREIAEQLNLSVKTVETHRERIKTKLDIRSGPELICHAVRWRLEGN
jgi:DNA-binding NarL/FixJ family response regulator